MIDYRRDCKVKYLQDRGAFLRVAYPHTIPGNRDKGDEGKGNMFKIQHITWAKQGEKAINLLKLMGKTAIAEYVQNTTCTVYAWDGRTCDMHLQGEAPADHCREMNRKRAISA